jgi:hypothetical protein
MSTHKHDRKQQATRVVAFAVAGVMIFSVLAAAILSQVW